MFGSLDILFISIPLFVELVGFILIILTENKIVSATIAKKGMIVVMVVLVLLSVLPFLMMPIPTSLLFPISGAIILIYWKKEPSDNLLSAMLVVHICYWFFGLNLLSSDGNTWGNSSILLGLVSKANSVLLINYFLLQLRFKKWMGIVIISAGIVGIILMYRWTNGLTLREYSGDQEELTRVMALVLCVLAIVKGVFLFKRSSAKTP